MIVIGHAQNIVIIKLLHYNTIIVTDLYNDL